MIEITPFSRRCALSRRITGTVEAAVLPAVPAEIHVVAYPWAEVRVDEMLAFHTPRAEGLALRPGEHRVVFTHPRYGTAEYDVQLEPGESRTIRHEFTEVPGT